MLTVPTLGTIDKDEPISSFSDVTSITKPTANGELCKLPYKVDSYTWDMYFCNKGFCPTATSSNSKCALGQFAHVRLFETGVYSVLLKAGTGGINGIDDQRIIYYYYIPNGIDIRMSIKLHKLATTMMSSTIFAATASSATSIPNALTITDADIIIISSSITTEMITDTSEKTTTLKVIPSETSTNIITENIELTSQTSASHLTITVADKQITSNSMQRIIILATVIPIGTYGAIISIIWLKYSVYDNKKKSNSVEMNQVKPASL
ncbi:unnamed protein product [Rotaria magnacalcarata]